MKQILFYAWGLPIYAYAFFLSFSFVFCILGMLWYDRRSAAPLRVRPDIGVWVFLAAALGEAITRIGCLCNGCCWGTPTRLSWGIHFPRYSFPWHQHVNEGRIWADASHSLPVHPTQLYMTLGLLVLFSVLLFLLRQNAKSRYAFCGYLIGYGVLRGVIETFRGDSAHELMGMTVSQVISIGLVFLGIVLLFLLRKHRCFSPVCNGTAVEQQQKTNERKLV